MKTKDENGQNKSKKNASVLDSIIREKSKEHKPSPSKKASLTTSRTKSASAVKEHNPLAFSATPVAAANSNEESSVSAAPMRKRTRKKSAKTKVKRKVGAIVTIVILAFLVVTFIIGQVLTYGYTRIKTEGAYRKTVPDYITANGYIIRDEQVIESDLSGVRAYTAEDGSRISKGSPVALVYASAEQAAAQEKIEKLKSERKQLEELQADGVKYNANPDLLNEQIDAKLSEIISCISEGDFNGVDSMHNSLLYSMSKYNIVTGKETDYNQRIIAISGEIEALSSRYSYESKSIQAPHSGYFIGKVDGYESVLKSSDAKSLTPVKLREAASAPRQATGHEAGKIVGEFDWYFAAVLSTEEAFKIESGYNISTSMYSNSKRDRIKLVLPYTSVNPLSVEVAAINREIGSKESLVVFRCDYMSADLAVLRYQPVQIILREYTGACVSARAVRTDTAEVDEKDEEGNVIGSITQELKYVYVIVGPQVKKRRINIVYQDVNEDIIICKVPETEEEKEKAPSDSLKYYDEVIVEGANIYEGKLITPNQR